MTGRSGEVRARVRWGRSLQTGLGLGWGRDREDLRDLTAGRVSVAPDFRLSLPGLGRISGLFSWTRVGSATHLPLFLGLADGHRGGHNLRWRLGADYRLARYVTAHLSYDGRKQRARRVLHIGRAEMRATF